ncbi:hypothetical protein [Microbulbifer discodermiae]|uniref:hypothetical protein n=1 Tax=Microbulbifer sp. 2201CG32-9 TaxID=3232309 RepID=UPI00345B742E
MSSIKLPQNSLDKKQWAEKTKLIEKIYKDTEKHLKHPFTLPDANAKEYNYYDNQNQWKFYVSPDKFASPLGVDSGNSNGIDFQKTLWKLAATASWAGGAGAATAFQLVETFLGPADSGGTQLTFLMNYMEDIVKHEIQEDTLNTLYGNILSAKGLLTRDVATYMPEILQDDKYNTLQKMLIDRLQGVEGLLNKISAPDYDGNDSAIMFYTMGVLCIIALKKVLARVDSIRNNNSDPMYSIYTQQIFNDLANKEAYLDTLERKLHYLIHKRCFIPYTPAGTNYVRNKSRDLEGEYGSIAQIYTLQRDKDKKYEINPLYKTIPKEEFSFQFKISGRNADDNQRAFCMGDSDVGHEVFFWQKEDNEKERNINNCNIYRYSKGRYWYFLQQYEGMIRTFCKLCEIGRDKNLSYEDRDLEDGFWN